MYMFEEMLPKIAWKTPDHKVVAINTLLGNPAIFTMEQLTEGCEIINELPAHELPGVNCAYGAWMQEWEESERGWGVRPDGVAYYLTEVAAIAGTEARVKMMREHEAVYYKGRTPDEYSRPSGKPRFVPVSSQLIEEIKKSKDRVVYRDRQEKVMTPYEKNRCFECPNCVEWERMKAEHCNKAASLSAGEGYLKLITEWHKTSTLNDRGLLLPCTQQGVADLLAAPECDKLLAVTPYSQKIGEFLQWLSDEEGVTLAQHHDHTFACDAPDGSGHHDCNLRRGDLVPFYEDHERLLARFFNIDLNKVEQERRVLLDALQASRCGTETRTGK